MNRGRARFSFSTATVASYTYPNEHSAPDPLIKITEIPIKSASGGDDHEPPPPPGPPPSSEVPISAHPASATATESLSRENTAAVVKIQSAYRSYMVRTLVKKMSAVNSEANYWERLIQRQVCLSITQLWYVILRDFGSFCG